MSPLRARSGGSAQRDHVEPVVEVVAEPAGADLLGEVALRARDDADVHVDRLASRRAARTRPAAGRAGASPAPTAGAARPRAGRGSRRSPARGGPPGASSASTKAPRSCPNSSDSRSGSESAAQFTRTNGRSRRGDDSCSACATCALPGAGLALHEHGRLGRGDAPHDLEQRDCSSGAAPTIASRARIVSRSAAPSWRRPPLLERLLEDDEDLPGIERADDVAVRAGAQRRDRAVEAVERRGDHDDRGVGPQRAQPRDHRRRVAVGERARRRAPRRAGSSGRARARPRRTRPRRRRTRARRGRRGARAVERVRVDDEDAVALHAHAAGRIASAVPGFGASRRARIARPAVCRAASRPLISSQPAASPALFGAGRGAAPRPHAGRARRAERTGCGARTRAPAPAGPCAGPARGVRTAHGTDLGRRADRARGGRPHAARRGRDRERGERLAPRRRRRRRRDPPRRRAGAARRVPHARRRAHRRGEADRRPPARRRAT